MKYEYKVIAGFPLDSNELNKRGKDGWELVSVTQITNLDLTRGLEIEEGYKTIWRRPKQ